MALFSRNKKEDAAKAADTNSSEKKTTGGATTTAAQPTDRDLASVIIKPRISEKSVGLGEKNVYTFVVRKDATKFDVRDAVKQIWGVTPTKVNIVNQAPRTYVSRSRGRTISQKGMKKAYVYLKTGDSIELA